MFGQLARQTPGQDLTIARVFEFFDTLFADADVMPFALRLWDGSRWHHGDGDPRFTLEIKHPSALRRLFWRPNELSLGEAYVRDEYDIHGDIEASFELADYLVGRQWRLSEKLRIGQNLLRMPVTCQAANESQAVKLSGRVHSKQRDAQAVRYHYNVSNDFYRLWLDQRMVYSCAFFHAPDEGLDQAQHRKLDYICRKLRLKPGEALLDIGCGWGGLIIHAAKMYGVEALGITLSESQAELARARIRAAGLADQCRVEVCDYRDLPNDQKFDKLASVGMIEHVGVEMLPEYYQAACNVLRPGGVFLNHGITESLNGTSDKGPSFIKSYVFPDGELMPVSTSLRFAEDAGLEVRDVECLREHYALTLRHWVKRLEANRDAAIALAGPETYRIWKIYMAGSAYGFRTGRIGVYQTLLVKSERRVSGLPLTRCDWYRPCPSESR